MSGIVKKIGAFAAQRAAATTECACNRSGWEFVAKKSECLPGKVSRVDSNKGQERKEKKEEKKLQAKKGAVRWAAPRVAAETAPSKPFLAVGVGAGRGR